jgi:hypothetical protein
MVYNAHKAVIYTYFLTMPVNEKILFRSFQYLFSLKSVIYAILSSAMLRENHAVFWGKNIDFRGGGGGE